MKPYLIALAASVALVPAVALAQHQGHAAPASPAQGPHAGHQPAPPSPPVADPHSGHVMPTPAQPAADPHAGHVMAPAQQPPDPHAGHAVQQPPAPPAQAAPCTAEHAAMGHCKMAMPKPAPAAPCSAEHAAMGHCTLPPAVDPHAGHAVPAEPATDPHAGHQMPTSSGADPHAGHAMPAMSAAPAPPVAPPPREAFAGPEHAGTTVWDRELFLRKREEELIDEHGGMVTWTFMAEQLEYRVQDGRDGYKWDLQGWYGGDYDKLWLKSEGEGAFGESPEQAEVQALYSRAIDPWFNFQAGIRHDFRPDPERTHVVVGIQGLARYWFEVDGSLFLSDKGDLTARFEAEYDQRITQKLILQPAIEFNLAAQDVPAIGIGSGLSSAEIGARLRYEIVPEFAPYIGVEYERAFGDTADFRRAEGEDAGGWSLLAGIRLWF